MKYKTKLALATLPISVLGFGAYVLSPIQYKKSIGLIVFGIGFCILGIASMLLQKRLMRVGIKCIGQIVDFKDDSDGNKTPIIEFTSLEGVVIQDEPTLFSSTSFNKLMPKERLNAEIEVLYDPADPKSFILPGIDSVKIVMPLLIVVGGAIVLGTLAHLAGMF